jgi:hypothetical protein
MQLHLDELSRQELVIYQRAQNVVGSMEEQTRLMRAQGLFEQYKAIHSAYWEVARQTTVFEVQQEALKRLVFLNWYSLLEPSCFTGVDELEPGAMQGAFGLLNNYLVEGKLDEEFTWMLSFYSCWEWIILHFAEPKLPQLVAFVNAVDTSILHVPKGQLLQGAMENRGQMGRYWRSMGAETTPAGEGDGQFMEQEQ